VKHEPTTPDPLDDTAAAALEQPDTDSGELAQLTRERDQLKDLLLRKSAEFDNYRKRTDRERATLSESIAAGVLEDLLPLIDDFERALDVAPAAATADTYRQGVELIHRQLVDLVRKRGVTPIEALGADFDPNYHQAVLYEPAEGRRDGEVIEELRRGYMIGDRLLRPSMVKVAKGQAA
jgi:molecular chaperone GrpE